MEETHHWGSVRDRRGGERKWEREKERKEKGVGPFPVRQARIGCHTPESGGMSRPVFARLGRTFFQGKEIFSFGSTWSNLCQRKKRFFISYPTQSPAPSSSEPRRAGSQPLPGHVPWREASDRDSQKGQAGSPRRCPLGSARAEGSSTDPSSVFFSESNKQPQGTVYIALTKVAVFS